MSASQHPYAADQVAEKVLRRIEVAKVARNLHDCLAFASFKAQNGWQDRTLKSIEPEITEKLKRKRPPFDEDLASDASSSSSDDFVPTTSIASNRFSRPSTAATFKVPDQAYTISRKRVRSASTTAADTLTQTPNWKQNSGLAHSSPALSRTDRSGLGTATMPRHSSEDSPMFDVQSDEEDHDVQLPSFAAPSSSIISSSPPRTPPPSRQHHNKSKESGVDLLLYLANSPSRSPAINVTHISSSSKEPPSTPPAQHAHLPSSMINTPGQKLGLFNGALQTPGPNFDFADYCNVTPSPAQAPWGGRTPGLSKTPSRFARSFLNSDTLHPPSNSPNMQRKPPASQGLALQLGEELILRSEALHVHHQ